MNPDKYNMILYYVKIPHSTFILKSYKVAKDILQDYWIAINALSF